MLANQDKLSDSSSLRTRRSSRSDIGVSAGNGKGQIFVRGEVIATVPESKIVETLVAQALELVAGQDR